MSTHFHAAKNVNHSTLVSTFIYLYCFEPRQAIAVSEITS